MKNNLRVVLAKQRMKLSDLAKKTGLSAGTLTAFYYERSNPSASTLVKICEALNVSLSDLLEIDQAEEA